MIFDTSIPENVDQSFWLGNFFFPSLDSFFSPNAPVTIVSTSKKKFDAPLKLLAPQET